MITISSPAFENEQMMPDKFTCQGENINPGLQIDGVPNAVKSLALIVDDPDAPNGIWNHWLVWNISPDARTINEASVPDGAVQGKNSSGEIGYEGPCPPAGTHRYFFKIFALDSTLNLAEGAKRNDLEAAMSGHIIEEGQVMVKYGK